MTAKEALPQPARTGSLCHAQDNAVLAMRPISDQEAMNFTVTGRSVRVVEWHNLHNDCRQDKCPPDGIRRTDWSGATAPRVAKEMRAYERLTGEEGALSATGTATLILTGSRALDVLVDGWLRMPGASGLGACSACTNLDRRTLQVEGQVSLADLRMEHNGTLSANLGGNIQSARLDEWAVDPSVLFGAGATIAIASAVVGLFLFVKLLAGFTRLEPDQAVIHPRRKAIYDYIRSKPGAGFREIMRNTNSSSASVRRHLAILKQTGHINEERRGKSRRFLPSSVRGQQATRAILLREETLAKLFALVERNPWLSQGEIMDLAFRELAFSRSTTQHRLGRMLEGGILQARREGRFILLALA